MTRLKDRAAIIDSNFKNLIKKGQMPDAGKAISMGNSGLTAKLAIDLFESQIISRHLDFQALLLKQIDRSFYTIGSSGHEGNVVLGSLFPYTDMAFLHYRDCALMVQRSKQIPHINIIKDILLSVMASKEDPISGGRHKVLGSKQLNIPPQTSTIASHLPKAFGTAYSIVLAKNLGLETPLKQNSVVICAFGDASANHSTAQGTFNAMSWMNHRNHSLPLIMVCEDNGLGISVKTDKNWIRERFSSYHYKYISCDGRDLPNVYKATREAESYVRYQRRPLFLHIKTVRLMGHAGSDIEISYREHKEIELMESHDPLLYSAKFLIENHILSKEEVLKLYSDIGNKVQTIADQCLSTPSLTSASEIMKPIIPSVIKSGTTAIPSEEKRKLCFGKNYEKLSQKSTFATQTNLNLTDLMLQHPQMVLFGEDISIKGGVYGITKGLFEKFGLKRVFNTLLDEQTILGLAIGLAHNGFLPIPEIQFLAYLHNAVDQLRGEAATLSFFSNGQFTNPMIIRIASFGYQKGFGGHFHNDNSIAFLCEIPGIVIAAPSIGSDAVRMFRHCVNLALKERRVVVFLEPIALYHTKDLSQIGDNKWLSDYPELQEELRPGELGVTGSNEKTVIISYANGYYLSRQAAEVLKNKHQIDVKLVDLRYLAPLDRDAIVKELRGAQQVLIVDECRQTGSISETLFTMIMEKVDPLPKLKRITGHDSFIPLGNASRLVLPSRDNIIDAVLNGF